MITVSDIVHTTCDLLGVNYSDFYSSRRGKDICLARWIVSFFAKEYTMNTSTRIGYLINRDHTTVLYGVAKVQGYVNVGDQRVTKLLSSIATMLMPDGRNHLQEIINKIQEREQ